MVAALAYGKKFGNSRTLLVGQLASTLITYLVKGPQQQALDPRFAQESHPAVNAATPGVDPQQVAKAKIVSQDAVHYFHCNLRGDIKYGAWSSFGAWEMRRC